jgi:uncharacterized protein (DUF2147 family)
MAITRQSDRRKSNRRESNRRKGDKKIVKIEEEGGKEQEMTVHEAVPKKKAKSAWNGLEEFTREWSETFSTKKRGKNRKR